MVYGKAISKWVKQAGKAYGQAWAAAGADFCKLIFVKILDFWT
jgi:hypothetical protein